MSNQPETTLPPWAEAIVPVDMDGAALVLGISRRFLVDVIQEHPHYERRGVRKVFYPEHIAMLRVALNAKRSKRTLGSGSGLPLMSPEDAFEKALALASSARAAQAKSRGKR